MPWYTIPEAANIRDVRVRQIYRLIQKGKIQTRKTPTGTMEVLLEETPAAPAPALIGSALALPSIPKDKVTEEIMLRVEGMLLSIRATDNIVRAERSVEQLYHINVKTQHVYKQELRRIFHLPPRAPLHTIADHGQIRQAILSVLVPKQRNDRGNLRVCKGLSIVKIETGEVVEIDSFLRSHYGTEGVSALSCWEALRAKFALRQVVRDDGSFASIDDCPPERTVRRFLQRQREESVAMQRARSRDKDWSDHRQMYVTRDYSKYRCGECFVGDHCELDFLVLNEEGKLDRRWLSGFIDMRSRMIVGFQMAWQPNSDTIAMAFRNSVTGKQIRILMNGKYRNHEIVNVCDEVMLDNGKDYRSRYTQKSFGKIKFSDTARVSVEQICKLHYVLPYHGQSKPIERFFKTIQEMMKPAGGYKGNRYDNKPDSLKTDIEQNNIMTVEQFDSFVALMIDTYNNRPHRSLDNQSPIQYYLSHQTMQKTIDERVLDFLLMRDEVKTVRRCQFTLFGQEYYHESLMKCDDNKKRKIEIYYNPADLGFVVVYIDGVFTCVAVNKSQIGQDSRSDQRILVERNRSEKNLKAEIKKMRGNITSDEVRTNILAGRLLNVRDVDPALLEKRVPNVAVMTGLEPVASQIAIEIDKAKAVVEIEEAAKRRKKKFNLSYSSVVENIR